MNIDKFIYLVETPLKSEILGTSFERLVFQELLPFVPGVTSIIKVGTTAPISVKGHEKSITLLKPLDNSIAGMQVKPGVYDLNKLSKLSAGHPDFVVQPIQGKNFLGYDASKDIYIEAKTTATGRYRFGQQTYGSKQTAERLFLDENSQIYKYLTWFGLRKTMDWDSKKVLKEFNERKANMLYLFKVFSGNNHRLVHALNNGSKIGFYALDDTVDLLSGSFELSDKNVLRFVYEKVPLFILERVDKVGAVRVYSKVGDLKTKAKELTLVKNEETVSTRRTSRNERFLVVFKAETTLHQVNNPNTRAVKPNQATITKGKIVTIEALVSRGRGKIALAAGTEYDFYKYLTEFRKEVKLV